jgi:hypothetical protein
MMEGVTTILRMISKLPHLFSHHPSNNQKARILHVEGLFVLFFILVSSNILVRSLSHGVGPLPAVLGFTSSITADETVKATNAARASAGLSPLSINSALVSAAVAKGNNMCADQYWAHISPSGLTPWLFMKNAGYKYAVAGENLARDFSDTPSMLAAWMASPTHKANIVNAKYKEIGIAVVNCKLLGSDTALVVQMFGTQLVAGNTGKITAGAVKAPQVKAMTTDSEELSGNEQVAGQASIPEQIVQADPVLTLNTPIPTSQAVAIFTPLQVQKSVIVSILAMLILVLILDMWLVQKHNTVRSGSRSLGHFLFFVSIFFLICIVRAGVTL